MRAIVTPGGGRSQVYWLFVLFVSSCWAAGHVNLRDEKETGKLKFFANHLRDVEDNLPIDPKYRNPKIGEPAPIRVVNEVFAAVDGNHGVQTAAYNLPNDERVITQKGSKRVMLKNVQEANSTRRSSPSRSACYRPPIGAASASTHSLLTFWRTS